MKLRSSVACAALAVSLSLSTEARADVPTCASLTNPVVVAGSSAAKGLMKTLSAAYSKQGTVTTLIYQGPGSCAGVNAVLSDPDTSVACPTGGCVKGTGLYYTVDGSNAVIENSCTFDDANGGTHVDVAVSDVFGTNCTDGAPIDGFLDEQGPAEAMVLTVPKAATGQQAIVAEESYFVFGFDDSTHQISPWTDANFRFRRDVNSGTQRIMAAAIGVPAGKWKGINAGANGAGSGGVLASVTGSSSPDKTIGLLGSDFYDQHRDALTQLAFRGFKQKHAYYTDSTATAFDKRNVRDGHYLPFGYVHLIARDAGGGHASAKAAQVIANVKGTEAVTGFDAVDAAISSHFVPKCAMKVQRSVEGGNLSAYTDAAPCGCYFESKVNQGGAVPASCHTCTDNAGCTNGQTCDRGFCESH